MSPLTKALFSKADISFFWVSRSGIEREFVSFSSPSSCLAAPAILEITSSPPTRSQTRLRFHSNSHEEGRGRRGWGQFCYFNKLTRELIYLYLLPLFWFQSFFLKFFIISSNVILVREHFAKVQFGKRNAPPLPLEERIYGLYYFLSASQVKVKQSWYITPLKRIPWTSRLWAPRNVIATSGVIFKNTLIFQSNE